MANLKKTKKLAVFDIDGTIFRSSLLIELVEKMIDKNLFPEEVRGDYLQQKNKWLDRRGSYEKYIDAVVAVFMKNIAGVSYTDFDSSAKEVVATHKDRVYCYTRDLIKSLKRKNFFLLAISNSPKGILDEFCKRLGFDKIYGRFYETGPSDKFTGKIVDAHLILNKANIVKRAVEKLGLSLVGSTGVGDTESDIPFLEIVEEPICFNPNAVLYQYAKRNGWKVVVERKDVIYHIK